MLHTIDLKYLELLLLDQKKILVDLNISIKNLKRLESNELPDEETIKRIGFFTHHVYQLRFIIIIQLAKLFSQNTSRDKRSFQKLFTSILNAQYDTSLTEFLASHKKKYENAVESHTEHPVDKEPEIPYSQSFAEWIHTKQELDKYALMVKSRKELSDLVQNAFLIMNTPEIDSIVRKVMDARDKVYAHTDPTPLVEFTSTDDLSKLILLANETYNRFSIGLWSIHVAFSEAYGWEIDQVFKRLSSND